VVLSSRYHKYLQAVEHVGHSEDGELHASNSHHNEEETWLLYLVDDEKGWYALRNWAHKGYLTVLPATSGRLSGCPRANAGAAADSEIWIMRRSEDSNINIPHGFFLQHKDTKKFLVAEGNEGHNTSCGGEVDATAVPFATRSKADWGGWWALDNSGVPTPGSDVWTAFRDVGGAIGDVLEAIGNGVVDVFQSIYDVLGGGHIQVCTSDDNNC
jgi:hypothetical protein